MDHKLAESLRSLDKYMLDELSGEERAQFEEHMFDCPICSDQVRQNFTVIENLKEVLGEQRAASSVETGWSRGGWRDWLRIPSLAPTFAALALACVLGYQNLAVGPGSAAQFLPQVAALQSTPRGENVVPTIRVDRKSPLFQLSVNADTLPAGSFACEFQNAAGKKVLTLNSGPQNRDLELRIQLATKDFPAGRYQLSLRPTAEPDRIITYLFAVEDNK